MTQLSRKQREEITEILKQVVGYTARERKTLLVSAFQGTNALEHVRYFDDSIEVFTTHLVDTMLNYGEVEKGRHALWAVLEAAQELMGVDYRPRIEALRPHIQKLSSYPVAPAEEKSFSSFPITPFQAAPAVLDERQVSPLQAARDYVNCMMPIPPPAAEFWMSSCLVSNGLYYHFINSVGVAAPNVVDPSYLKHWIDDKPRHDYWHLPVTNITFRAATAFAEWLSRFTSSKVRLPRLEEWKIAASAGRSNWFKEEIDAGRVNYHETAGHLHSVDAFNPNPYGIRDLIGQVFDLCVGDDDLSKPVIVGGCHYQTEDQLAASLKGEEVRPDKCLRDAGFRCVRST